MKSTLTLGRHSHVHTCQCGNELYCTTDDCAVGQDWQCPRCDQIQQDEFYQRTAAFNVEDVTLATVAPWPPKETL